MEHDQAQVVDLRHADDGGQRHRVALPTQLDQDRVESSTLGEGGVEGRERLRREVKPPLGRQVRLSFDGREKLIARCNELVFEVHQPTIVSWPDTWVVEPLELMCAPKGVGPRRLRPFPCKAATSGGAAVGPWVPMMDPRSCRRSRLCASWGGGHAPVVAVLVTAVKRKKRQTCPFPVKGANIRVAAHAAAR
jgi:hypothetical protein